MGPRTRLSSCCVLFLVSACAVAAAEDASSAVPLPLLLETLRSDVLHLPDVHRVPRGVGGVAADAGVPWYSAATRGDDDDTASREELIVTNVFKDDTFNLGAGVTRWHSLVVGSTTHFVGLRDSHVTLLTGTFIAPDVGSGHTYSLSEHTYPVSGTPLAAGLFKHWNAVTKTLEAILVLSIDSDDGILMWYRITPSGLDVIRAPWPVHKKAATLKVFEVRDRMKLLILTSCNSTLEIVPCLASADLYDFSLDAHLDPKLSQSITLEEEAVTAEIGTVGDQIHLALALPGANVVKLYRYVWPLPSEVNENGNHSIHGWFDLWKDLHSPQVSHAVFFHVSYKMYLAIGGEKPTLLRFASPTRMESVPNALQNVGFVSTWVVLPVPSYRDEVILLAEVLDSTSGVKRVVTLTWASSGVFNWQNQPPCYVNGAKFPVEGASCLIAESTELGLAGAVAYRLGDASVVSILLPRGKQSSSVYHIYTQLQPVLNPLLAEVLILKDAQAKLRDEMLNQQLEMDKTEQLLLDTLSLSGPNIIKADWIITEVETPEHENDGTLPPINEPGWSVNDQSVQISELRELLDQLRSSTQTLADSLIDAAVPVNGVLHLNDYQALLGGVDVANHSEFVSLSVSVLNGEPVPSLLKDIVRSDRMEKIGGTKTLSHVKTVDVDFITINNVPRDDLVFNIPDKPVRVYGNVEVTQVVHVDGNLDLPSSGTVGGIDLSEEIFIPGRAFQGVVRFDEVTVEGDLNVDVINTVEMNPRHLKSIVSGQHSLENVTHYDSLNVAGNVLVERVNGFLWSDLVERLVWKNESATIKGRTLIDGTITSEQINIHHLNGLEFPTDFVLKTTETQRITGNKTMANGLFVGSLDVSNTVDGVPVNAFVTLKTSQHLDGELKLEEADIKGDVKVDDAVNGIRLNQMHTQSPLINEGGVVSSNVFFSNLEVLGPIQITGILDGRVFKDDILNVVVLPPSSNDTVVVRGKKVVKGNLKVGGMGVTVTSGVVNAKKISDLARIDKFQEFHGEKYVQNAIFGTVELTGLWDDVSVVDLNSEAVRLTGTQVTNTHLNFVDSSKLFASRLLITKQLNTHVADLALNILSDSVCGAASTDKCVIQGPVNASVMKVAGNVVIDGKVCNWNLVDFETRRMSRSRPQTITGKISLGNMNVQSHVSISALNSVPVESFNKRILPNFSTYEDLEKLLFSGGFAVDELFIEGNIRTTNGVNFLNLSRIAQNAVKLVGGNMFEGSLFFEEPLTVGSLDVRGPINGLNLAYMIEDAVLKNDLRPVTISGIKKFDAGFAVAGTIVTNNLNGFEPSKIITKSSPALIQGSLRVLGDVYTGNINVTGLLNGIPVSAFLNRYKYLGQGRHELLGNAHFLDGVAVDDLYVMNSVNGVELEQFFKSVVMKDEPSRIPGFKVFVNRVAFIDVDVNGLVNGIPLRESVQDVVLVNDDQPVIINGSITIANDLTAPAGVILSENLDALELDGCLIKEWVDNAIYLNKPTDILGVKTFASMSSNSDLALSVINALDLSKVITLKGIQDIPANVRILAAALRHNLKVDGRVNGRILQSEYDNTLLISGNQIVTGSKTFLSGLTVNSNVLTKGYISDRDITNVVTLESNDVINGPLKFTNVVIDGDMRVSGLISGLDLVRWNEHAFLTNSPQPQLVTGSWDVKGQVRFMESVGGHGLLDGQNVNNFPEFIRETREFNRRTQANIKDEWIQLCRDTDALLAKARAQPFLFQQLEVVQAIQSSKRIASMHAFEALSDQFLAVSYTDHCSGAMYRWNRQKTAWDLLDESVQNIGSVEKWATLRNSDATYLITSAEENNCPYQGGNVWRFEPSVKLRNVYTMDSWHDATVDQEAGYLHLLGRSGVNTWSLEDGDVKLVSNKSISGSDRAQFIPRSAGLGLSVTDGKSVTVLEGPGSNATLGMVSRSANSNLPAWSRGNVVTMKIADGRKLVAVSAEGSDLLVVYEDVATGQSLARVQVENAHSLSVLELTAPGRNGQTLLAFIENERHLRVVQYKGVEGFVDVTEAKLAVSVKEMVPVRLFTRGLVNQRHFLLLRSDHQVLSLEVEMAGDPLDEAPLNCNLV